MVNFEDGKTPLSAETFNKLQKDLQEQIDESKGVVLYDNEVGISNTIELSDSINNFKKIEIYITRGDICTFKGDNGEKTIVSCQVTGDAGNLRQFFCNITFNEKIITFGKQYFRDSDGYGQEYTGIKITKVIGYK